MSEHQQTQQSKESKPTFQKQATPTIQTPVSNPASIIQHARINPKSLTPAGILQLQRTIGNRAVGRLLSEIRNPLKVQQVPIQRQTVPEEEKEPLQGMFGKEPEEESCPSCMQRQEIPEEEEPLQGKFETIQRLEPEEEEKLQMKSVIQRQEIPEEEEPLQGKMAEPIQCQEIPDEDEPLQGKMIGTIQRQEIPEEEEPLQTKRENNTGMPDNLKAGVESLSGIDMSDVRVHYNSSKPAEVGALAYTQGTNIHVAPGQERCLPHEAWHVVQQAQGRVKPTMQLKEGVSVNDDEGLEHEADEVGAKATVVGHLAPPSRFSQDGAGLDQVHPECESISGLQHSSERVVQRQKIAINGVGTIETSALRLNELRALKRMHPEVAKEIDDAIQKGEYFKTRYRKKAKLSEGESEEDTPTYFPDKRSYYRSLREEEVPEEEGLRPPKGSDPSITARAHVAAGSRADVKSAWNSGTHSLSVSGAWAAGSFHRVAKFSLPPGAEFHDLTTATGQEKTGLTGTALNAAKSSQEVLVRGNPPESGIPPEYVESVYSAERLRVRDYRELRDQTGTDRDLLLRTRRRTGESPAPIRLTRVYNREEASARRLEAARQVWDKEVEDIVDQTNTQYADMAGFIHIDEEEVAMFLEEYNVENAHNLDFISNDQQLQRYLAELKGGLDMFIHLMIETWSPK